MQTLLLSLYPKVWREQYGEEYEALIEDSGMSFVTMFDIAKTACLLRLNAHGRGLSVLLATFFYALNGLISIRLGLTANWPLWAPTNPARAAALLVTLAPFIYALYVRFSLLLEHKQQWQGSTLAFWLVASPLTAISTLVLAFMCSFFLVSLGMLNLGGEAPYICGALALVSVGCLKLLSVMQGRLLQRFTT